MQNNQTEQIEEEEQQQIKNIKLTPQQKSSDPTMNEKNQNNSNSTDQNVSPISKQGADQKSYIFQSANSKSNISLRIKQEEGHGTAERMAIEEDEEEQIYFDDNNEGDDIENMEEVDHYMDELIKQHLPKQPQNQKNQTNNQQIQKTENQNQKLNEQKQQTQQMSALEFLKKERNYLKIFKEYIEDKENWPEINQKQKFSLIEDIAILYFKSVDDFSAKQHTNNQISAWTKYQNQGYFKGRSKDSLRDRFKKYLCFLNKDNIMKIYSFILEQGCQGYLIFEEFVNQQSQKQKKLVKIEQVQYIRNNKNNGQKSFNKNQKQQTEVSYDDDIENVSSEDEIQQQNAFEQYNKINQKNQQDYQNNKRNLNQNTNQQQSYEQQQKKISYNFNIHKQQQQNINQSEEEDEELNQEQPKQIYQQNKYTHQKRCNAECVCQINEIYDQNNKKTILQMAPYIFLDEEVEMKKFNQRLKIHTDFTTRKIIQDSLEYEETFNKNITFFQEKFDLTRKQVVDELCACSGEWADMYVVLSNKNVNLKWYPEDDEILENVKEFDDATFQMIYRQKGYSRIKKRLRFKKIQLPFNFDFKVQQQNQICQNQMNQEEFDEENIF